MEEINNFQQEPDETLYQAWERFKELLMKCPRHYLTEMQEVILFYNGLDVPTRQLLDSKGAIPTKTTVDAKVNEKVYVAQVGCEQCKGPHYTKDCPLKEEGKTLKEAYYTQFGAPFQQGGHYRASALGFYQRNNANPSKISKVLQGRGFGSLPRSTETNPRDHAKSISTTIEADMTPIRRIESSQYNALADLGASVSVMPLLTYLNLGLGELAYTKLTVELADRIVKHPKGITENVLVGIGKFVFPVDFIKLDMPEDVIVPLILRRPFLSTAHTKIDVFKRMITLRVGDEKIIFKSVKPASSLM
ncbi:integrase, catalytic region, zinc finger, CCHC-type containing protein [Tanacetum coccineum]